MPPVLINLNAEIICRKLADLGIWHETEWIPADNLWVLFFKTYENKVEGCAFKVNGYFAPLLLVHSGTLNVEEGYISVDNVISLIKNAYCTKGKK